MIEHTFHATVEWDGNRGNGTSGYRAYGREHTIRSGGKPDIAGSSAPEFLGDAARWNPEELLVASASACHKLWYLHLCAENGISVVSYVDDAEGTMRVSGGGQFTRVALRPTIVLRDGDDIDLAMKLHHQAHAACFIANSLNFPVECEPTISCIGR